MADRVVATRPVVTLSDGAERRRYDHLAAEEPMEVRVNGDAVSVTMRTPGDDFDLALGFCFTEGIVAAPDAVSTIRYCDGSGGRGRPVGLSPPAPPGAVGDYNVVEVSLRDPTPVAPDLRRHVYTTSSCGVCGTASIDAVRRNCAGVHDDAVRVDAATLVALPDRLRAAQRVFERTGGLHAAGLFSADGDLMCLREDVGRHNAVDKVIGWAARAGRLPLRGHVLLVSGRVAFEIAQKALVAGIPVVAAVSAPSSLAVSLADESGMTLVGFLRGTSMNVYAGADRVLR